MLRDWVKMRTDLYRDPKVVLIADRLNESVFGWSVTENNAGRNVTRNVMRNATVGALVTVWGVMRHAGKRIGDDLVVPKANLAVIDDIADMPGLGESMAFVGWAKVNADGVVLPAFFAENNVDPSEDRNAKNAERQKRWREKQREKRDVTRNVTDNVTSNTREEESRGEIEKTHTPAGGGLRKPEQPQRCPHEQGQQAVMIPEKMRTEKCLKAFEDWCDYLDSQALDVINPRYNFKQAEAVWQQANRIGPERWPVCVEHSIANAYRSIINRTEPVGGGGSKRKAAPETDPDFVRAVQVCREYPTGSDYDRQQREQLLGESIMRVVRLVKSSRLADVNEFNHKQMAEEWRVTKDGLK